MPEERSDDYSKERGREIIENMAAQQRALDEAARPKGDGSESESDKNFMQVLRKNEDTSDVVTAEEMAEEMPDE